MAHFVSGLNPSPHRWIAGIFLSSVLAASQAAAQDFGYEGPSYSGGGSSASGSKPESKLWFHDDDWWASLWNSTVKDFHIWRLDPSTEKWIDTGVLIDDRDSTRADVLSDGDKLYVASHRFSESASSGYPSRLYRYTYNPAGKTYTPDSGFPVQINNFRTETLVIEKDSTGTLWATWMQSGRVYVNHTLGSDTTWGSPYILPSNTTAATSDDISSVIHFGGNRIGILWSDQNPDKYWFSIHNDGESDTTWSSPENAMSSGFNSDDHINLKADSQGRVYACGKTSGNDIVLLRRSATGTWTTHLVSEGSLSFTRGIVQLDQQAGKIYVYASYTQSGGTISEKVSNFDPIAFDGTLGTPILRDASALKMNNASSTKQNFDSASGGAVLGTVSTTNLYWHHHSLIQGPEPPIASFTATPTSGDVPLSVQFTDTSTHAPTQWTWDFGDGNQSSSQNPLHVYTVEGIYTVSLTVSNSEGSDTNTQANLINVGPPPPEFTIEVSEDAHVKSTSPSNNYGTVAWVRARLSSEIYRPYLKFNVAGLPGPVIQARLRLFATDGSPDGGSVYAVDNGWSELSINWNNAPLISGNPLTSAGSVATESFVELDVTSAVTGDGTYSFAITSANSNSIYYSSSEGAVPPVLIIDYLQ